MCDKISLKLKGVSIDIVSCSELEMGENNSGSEINSSIQQFFGDIELNNSIIIVICVVLFYIFFAFKLRNIVIERNRMGRLTLQSGTLKYCLSIIIVIAMLLITTLMIIHFDDYLTPWIKPTFIGIYQSCVVFVQRTF